MKTIKIGSRGAAVEDIQRRLNYLGFSVGSSGVDGVFLEDTANAVRQFQASVGLRQDGAVDSETWSQLVDSTFIFGDRLLYLRFPFFHGRDVQILQTALNSLGFVTGAVDGIFGPSTEEAVSDFQNNLSLPVDGVVGFDTYDALQSMKHMWEGREVVSHSEARKKVNGRRLALKGFALKFIVHNPRELRVARRIQNLAAASFSDSEIFIEQLSPEKKSIPIEAESYASSNRPIITIDLFLRDLAEESSNGTRKEREVAAVAEQGIDSFINTVIPLDFEKKTLEDSLKQVIVKDTPAYILLDAGKSPSIFAKKLSSQAMAVYILDSFCEALS